VVNSLATKKRNPTLKVQRGPTGLVDLAVGVGHACGVKRGGTVVCWGMGPGTARPFSVQRPRPGQVNYQWAEAAGPRAIAGIGDAVAVVAGTAHTCVRTRARGLVCWGDNEDKQVGSDKRQRPAFVKPMVVAGTRSAAALAAAQETTCFTDAAGLHCFGAVDTAPGHITSSARPMLVFRLPGVKQIVLARGHGHTVYPKRGAAVDARGRLWLWGEPFAANAGKDAFKRPRLKKVGQPVVEVALGERFACARTSGGRVACFGKVGDGQLGAGHSQRHLDSRRIDYFSPARWIAVGAGHTCALITGGAVRCAGRPDPREVAPAEPTPRRFTIEGLTGAKLIAGHIADICGLFAGGRVRCARVAEGEENRHWPAAPSKRRIVALRLRGIVALAAGRSHHCALRQNGKLACWGSNGHGAFAREKPEESQRPVAARGLPPLRAVAGADAATCGITRRGGVLCWGDNQSGLLGREPAPKFSDRINVPPRAVPGVKGARSIAGGDESFCVLDRRGRVTCWGILPGRPSLTGYKRQPPRVIDALGPAVAVDTSARRTCAVREDGTVRCWTHSEGPRPVPGLTEIVQVAVSDEHSCARTKDGGVYCWGNNENGALGFIQPAVLTHPVWVAAPGAG
jgi:alpha-tubulin suppressor-like RCC1 family protein